VPNHPLWSLFLPAGQPLRWPHASTSECGAAGMQRATKQAVPELGPGRGAQTIRGKRRRDLILEVAAKLFAQNGFDSVSINEIGIAAGITGPAIYRYFASKEALLVSVYQRLYQRFGQGVQAILSEDLEPWEALEKLIDLQVTLAVEETEKIRIVDDEGRHLPVKEAAEFRAESRRQLSVWIDVLGRARPDLRRLQCEMTVHALLAMINSVADRRDQNWEPAVVRNYLRAMALSTASTQRIDEDEVGARPV
jgi:AcrR family transcriptional regulator